MLRGPTYLGQLLRPESAISMQALGGRLTVTPFYNSTSTNASVRLSGLCVLDREMYQHFRDNEVSRQQSPESHPYSTDSSRRINQYTTLIWQRATSCSTSIFTVRCLKSRALRAPEASETALGHVYNRNQSRSHRREDNGTKVISIYQPCEVQYQYLA